MSRTRASFLLRLTGMGGLVALTGAPAHAAMTQVLEVSGPLTFSIDGAGSVSADTTITINKPTADATVYAVFAEITSIPGAPDPSVGALTIAGVTPSLDHLEHDASWEIATRWDDVTAELAATLEALPAGPSDLTMHDNDPGGENDGHALFVVWQDPALPLATLALALGADFTYFNPSLALTTTPIDPAVPGLAVTLGVGISFSAGYAYSQYSTLTFNGGVVYDQIGGYDDGDLANGALFTIGGDGDTTDGEVYDITPLVIGGETHFDVVLSGASPDDYDTAIWLQATGVVGEGVDADADGLPDATEALYGTDQEAFDTDLDGLGVVTELLGGTTDPLDADSDDGGAPDGRELLDGTDPLDPGDDLVPVADTGDTGTADTGDTGATAASADTGTADTADSGDTGSIDTADTGATGDSGSTGDTAAAEADTGAAANLDNVPDDDAEESSAQSGCDTLSAAPGALALALSALAGLRRRRSSSASSASLAR